MRYITALATIPLALAAPLTARNKATKYIVVLKGNAPSPQSGGQLASIAGGAVASIPKDRVYEIGSFKGFAADLTADQINALKADPTVAYITVDSEVRTQDKASAAEAEIFGSFVTQKNVPTWGLGRISNRKAGVTDYSYHRSAGEGTCSYIIDTGLYADHPEFEGRAEQIKNFASDATSDDNGHGTHVAGTIGSKTYGVAKKTKLLSIKVLDEYGSGSWSDVIAGISYAVNDTKTRDCENGATINMSLGGSRDQAINDAVAAAVDAGVFVAVAAGNDGLNTDGYSPSSEPKAFTVGATDKFDNITSFSNYGFLVDSFAPGLNINSTWIGGPDAWRSISGTSMATPHVAGLASYLLGLFGSMEPAALATKIKVYSTKNKVQNIYPNTGTANFLVYNGKPGF